jgi:hypothetical protein
MKAPFGKRHRRAAAAGNVDFGINEGACAFVPLKSGWNNLGGLALAL